MKQEVEMFLNDINRLYGLYLDSNQGFSLIPKKIDELQSFTICELKAKGKPAIATSDYLDQRVFIYGKGRPGSRKARKLHTATQGDVKNRNIKNGINSIEAAKSAIVSLYQYWEDFHRNAFAKSVGARGKDIKAPVMGDLRLLRISIIHHRGVAKKDVENCEILKWFKEGEEIELSQDQMIVVFDEVALFCEQFDATPSLFIQG